MVEDANVAPESLPADAPAPSAAPLESQVSEQAPPPTSPPVQAPEPPFHEHPRWKELQQDREALRDQNRMLAETLQRMAPQPVVQVESDPYAGMDAPTAEFYRQMDRRIEQKANQVAFQQLQPIQQALNLGRQQLAEVTLTNFYKDNPEVTPNSQESLQIAEKVSRGYPLEDAKWIVLGPRYAAQAKAAQQGTQVRTQQAAQKRALPPDAGTGIPAASGLPTPKLTFREVMAQELAKAEREAASA